VGERPVAYKGSSSMVRFRNRPSGPPYLSRVHVSIYKSCDVSKLIS
jgi:hypothetical protein